MQNASFTTEPLSIKSMGAMQELEVRWIKAVPAGNLLTHPTLLTDTTQIHSYICAWSQDRKNTAFLQRSISLLPSSLDLRQRGKKGDCFKVGSSVYLQYAATFPTSPWHGSHYTADVAFLLSLSSLFPPSNHFFDQLNRLGQKIPSSGVLQRGYTAITNIYTESATAMAQLDRDLHAFCPPLPPIFLLGRLSPEASVSLSPYTVPQVLHHTPQNYPFWEELTTVRRLSCRSCHDARVVVPSGLSVLVCCLQF